MDWILLPFDHRHDHQAPKLHRGVGQAGVASKHRAMVRERMGTACHRTTQRKARRSKEGRAQPVIQRAIAISALDGPK